MACTGTHDTKKKTFIVNCNNKIWLADGNSGFGMLPSQKINFTFLPQIFQAVYNFKENLKSKNEMPNFKAIIAFNLFFLISVTKWFLFMAKME